MLISDRWSPLIEGRCVVEVSSHMYAMVDGVVHERKDSIDGGHAIRGKNVIQGVWMPPAG